MAWRPHEHLIDGYLDNTVPGIVTGHLRFRGMDELVRLNLAGDFHRDIRGAVLSIKRGPSDAEPERPDYMDGFSAIQDGDTGDITAGLPPVDYVAYPYIEWYSLENGRVVLELEPHEVEVVGSPLIAGSEQPLDRTMQADLMARFLANVAGSLATRSGK
jgi:hypothetical protein